MYLLDNPLNDREREIITYIAQGYTAKSIARMVGLEHRTIEVYVANIRRKLFAKNTAHAVYIASQRKFLKNK